MWDVTESPSIDPPVTPPTVTPEEGGKPDVPSTGDDTEIVVPDVPSTGDGTTSHIPEVINGYRDFYFVSPDRDSLEVSLGFKLDDPPDGVLVDYIGVTERTPPIFLDDNSDNLTIVTPATYYPGVLTNIRISSSVIPDKFVNSKFLIPDPKTPIRVWF